MKKNLLFLLLFISGLMLKAQDINKTTALQLVSKNSIAIGLSGNDITNVLISAAYHDRSTGLDMIYLQQSFKGLPVFNSIQVLSFRNGAVVSNAGGRIADIEKAIGRSGTTPAVTAANAVRTAMAEKNISTSLNLTAIDIIPGKKSDFGKLDIATENITAELMWVPLQDGKKVQLAWQVYLVPVKKPDYWMIRVDANSNKVISENNLTVYCNWNPSKKPMFDNRPVEVVGNSKSVNFADAFNFNKYTADNASNSGSPSIVNSASYRVIPFPAESPRHPGGTPAVVTDPWTAAPGNATSLKWHSNGTTDYNITRSNNVWAKEDHASNNSNAGQPATSTTPDPLTFNFIPDFSKRPNQTTPVPNQQFNITNLFYWDNIYHDVMYQYGFDEPAGNFQDNNQGRGGAGNDFVYGDAQDGNFNGGNQNNANFSTPADGGNGRMQMYLWDTAATLTVNTPASIARVYTSIESQLSTANKLINLGPVTGQVVYYNDNAAGTTHEACTPPANSLAGKIALIDRATCTFVVKIHNAQDAGAIAVIMVNNVDGLITMAGADNTITIPAVLISTDDGAILKAQLANNLNVTLYGSLLDGDADNGVMMHEHSHGLSNRLTGGPAQASCLANAEQAGEGWSDYYSLMFTQNWATSNLNSGFSSPRGIGTYVIGQVPSDQGIRSQKYCTDFTINNLVYDANIDPEPHNRGELWCATLWDMTWNIINQDGTINPNIYNPAGGGGNTIALKLVTEGLKLQPCSPGFIDGRNAILKADTLLYGGAYSCVIKEAFRRRGMGANASQGSSSSVTDQVADFAPINCVSCTDVVATTQPVNTTACTGSTASFSVTVTGTNPTYQWQVSTDGGVTFTNIAGATSATLNLTAVTAAMNNNRYRVIISNTCPSTVTSSAAILTVNNPASITSQPAASAVCVGSNTSFSVTATGSSNTYQWQVSTDGGVTFTDIAGATTATLNLTAVTAAMSGNQYQVIISSCGPNGLTSNAVTLTVNTPASITGQPVNTSACTGGAGTATFTVTAAGTSNTYQWQVSTNGGVSFTNIPGATSATLTLTGVTSAMNNNVYQVIITNSCSAAITSTQVTLTVSDPATISAQPVSSAVCEGTNTSFTIVTAGSGVTYQWQVSTDGGVTFTDIPGATGATLNLPAVTGSMNNNQYHVEVFSCSPTGLNSNNVTLTVNSLAAVTTQPSNTTACVGNNATITVTAAGTNNTYQWQVSTDGGITFTDIAGATTATLTLTGVTTALNNNIYHVIITNACTPAGVTSANATLTVSNTATLTTQPVNTTACEGSNAVFTATASGASYQWQVSTDGGITFTDIAGATTTTLTLTSVTAAMNNNQYQLVVGSCGSTTITSDHVTLTVTSLATITAQPLNTAVCDGADATFSVTAAGGAPVTYQWSVSTDGGATYTPIAGATTNTLTITGVTAAQNNNLYQVTVSNSCTPGLASGAATLTVNPASSITTQPVSTSACEGSSASFSATVSNASGANYQWQVSTDGGVTFTNIPGATDATLVLPAVTAAMNNNSYQLLVNICGTLTSSAVVLTVNSLPVVVITASPYVSLTSDLTTTLTATSTPASSTFSWYKNDVQIAGVTGNTIQVSHDQLGAYRATATDANGCTNSSNTLTIADSLVNIAFIYPNPNSGMFHVRYKGIGFNGQPRIISMYDAKGARVFSQNYVVVTSYQVMDVDASRFSKGVYMLVLSDVAGNTLGTGKVVIR